MNMKMLMIVCPENRREEVRALIAQHDVHSYSEIPNVLGEGKTGKRKADQPCARIAYGTLCRPRR